MKRWIKGNDFQIKVEVLVDAYTFDHVAAASTIRPVEPNYPDDRIVDEQALADYHAFIEESIARIEDFDLEVIQHNSSKASATSEYYTIVDLTQDIERTAKYMIFLRISDHAVDADSERMEEIRKEIRSYRRRASAAYSRLQGHRIIWKVRQVIVNDKQFNSYDDAVEYIADLAEEWSETLSNSGYISSTTQVKASDRNEAFNYSGYLIEYSEDGWHVYENYSYKELAGPFRTWVEAEEYVDQNLD